VAEELLDRPDVVAADQEVGGEGVPQGVAGRRLEAPRQHGHPVLRSLAVPDQDLVEGEVHARIPGPGADPRRYLGDTMKKQTKKLVLAKETLTSLEKNGLGRVAGGVSANTDCTYTNCCSGLAGCGSTYCHETSGSRLC
jgi:hypothetical protein